jgi:cystathionine beta-lyase/cystathionine gamma-synthase
MNPDSTAAQNPETGFSTLCIHAGTDRLNSAGGVTGPIFTSTAYGFPNVSGKTSYPRYFNTPNQLVIARKLAILERGEEGMVFGSGMAAISNLLFSVLKPGDHAVFQNDLYGGTHHLATVELARFGIESSFVASSEGFAGAIRPNTKVLYIESPSNPLLRCLDLAALAKLGRTRKVMTIVDNTFATPINQNPLAFGIDAVAHSGTKYLNGHSDISAGAVVSSASVIGRLRECAIDHGGVLDASACYQLERGLKTLALRMGRHNENGMALARVLQSHPAVARVNYPGLPDHPDHAVAAGQMRGFGGMLSFELREPEGVAGMMDRLRIATPALSLGGVETLVCVPASTSHKSLTREERAMAGISDGLVRVSTGIEDTDDLIADFRRAL